jgi:glycosyltransferase involved in cell wall biosynthesis
VIAVARYMADGLERDFGLAGIRAIPNAVDLAAFAPRPPPPGLADRLALPPGTPMVLCPGRLLERKRPLDVLRAAELVVAARPETVFVFAGSGDRQAAIESFVRERGLERSIRLPGWLPPDEMPGLYHRADVVVMASSEEGMSRVYLEAMASGRPLVASDIPPARELIAGRGSGVLFPLGDHAALAERIGELLADPARRSELGSAGRLAVADRGIDRAVAAYLSEFAGLVARRRSPEWP